jgi:hypothetical protein
MFVLVMVHVRQQIIANVTQDMPVQDASYLIVMAFCPTQQHALAMELA